VARFALPIGSHLTASSWNVPTEEQRAVVAMMAGVGYAQDRIAMGIEHQGKPITETTLKKHFSKELATGRSK
jgi:hypothetical protein